VKQIASCVMGVDFENYVAQLLRNNRVPDPISMFNWQIARIAGLHHHFGGRQLAPKLKQKQSLGGNMKSTTLMCLVAIMFFAALAIPVRLAAQANQDHRNSHHHHRYQLIDLGTFGGPASYFSNGADGILNNHGKAVGYADTPTPDPFPSFCFDSDCFVAHAFQWRHGMTHSSGGKA
jgi:hypothetical protein